MTTTTTNHVTNTWGQNALTDGFTTLPNILARYALKAGCTPVEYTFITILSTFKHDSNFPFPSNQTLANILQVQVRQINKIKKSLTDKGLLKVIDRKNGEKQLTSICNFQPLIDKCLALFIKDKPMSEPVKPAVPVGHGGDVQEGHSKKTREKEYNKNTSKKDPILSRFNDNLQSYLAKKVELNRLNEKDLISIFNVFNENLISDQQLKMFISDGLFNNKKVDNWENYLFACIRKEVKKQANDNQPTETKTNAHNKNNIVPKWLIEENKKKELEKKEELERQASVEKYGF